MKLHEVLALVLACLLLYFSISDSCAEPVLVKPIPNADAVVLISKDKCGKDGNKAYVVRADNGYIPGCATPVMAGGKPMIHIQWEKGDWSEFPPTDFFPQDAKRMPK